MIIMSNDDHCSNDENYSNDDHYDDHYSNDNKLYSLSMLFVSL